MKKGECKEDITGKTFGKWIVLGRDKDKTGYWICQCQCDNHTIKSIRAYTLKSGQSTSCGCSHLDKFIGKQFSEWTVLEYAGNGNYKCRCSCGNIRIVSNTALKSGSLRSCGHNNILKGLVDLSGKQFGYWTVLRYADDHKWKCQCKCGNIRDIEASSLKDGTSKSCGCKVRDDNLKKYGDISAIKKDKPRDIQQINAVKSAENLKEYILKLLSTSNIATVTLAELSQRLNITQAQAGKYIHEYKLEELIDYFPMRSAAEKELYDFIVDTCESDVLHNIRNIVENYELDIYIPEQKIAIEFNGNYWHSSDVKDKYYHQRKTVACGKKGIRLIHIFEYEWSNKQYRKKLELYLRDIINGKDANKLYARCTIVKEIRPNEAYDFEDENHLSGRAQSSINIGMYHNDALIGVMTFGKSRFDKSFEYELIRLCFKSNIHVIGGASKLFKHFVSKYNPKLIISYCDISKFTGKVYLDMGFKLSKSVPLTDPNYVWVDFNNNDVIPRYKAQKHKLIKLGLGNEAETENSIMHKLGYHKIYNSGNFKFEWAIQDRA